MKTAKQIAVVSVFVALLIGGQFALSMFAGIEVVTVLLLSFCFCFGIKYGLISSTAFSLLRCFIFGFFPTVIILYLVYYNIFAFVIGFVGNKFNHEISPKKLIVLVILAVVLTAFFTVIDNILTPLYYGFSVKATKAYWVSSLTSVVPHVICAFATTLFLSYPIIKVFKTVKI